MLILDLINFFKPKCPLIAENLTEMLWEICGIHSFRNYLVNNALTNRALQKDHSHTFNVLEDRSIMSLATTFKTHLLKI